MGVVGVVIEWAVLERAVVVEWVVTEWMIDECKLRKQTRRVLRLSCVTLVTRFSAHSPHPFTFTSTPPGRFLCRCGGSPGDDGRGRGEAALRVDRAGEL